MNTFIEEAFQNVWKGSKKKPVYLMGTSIYPQTNNWSCGPMSLRYWLARWGHDVSVSKLAKLAGSSAGGTWPLGMSIAVHRCGGRMKQGEAFSSAEAKKRLDSILNRNNVALLCVNKFGHWMVCIAKNSKGYLVLEPGQSTVIQLRNWKYLNKKMRYAVDGKRSFTYSIDELTKPKIK